MAYEYIVNATLEESSPTYVRRKADEELYQGLRSGNFCYVFNARKTGKSSLRVQVMSRLKKEGIVCSVIDISGKNTQQTSLEQWYAGMLNDITKDFKLEVNLRSWIKEHNWLSPLDRFKEFIESIMLAEIRENIVIFLDEIDSVLSLNFPSDDFFAFIRACHNWRADNPEYKRLTFCLLGVATPSDLIADKKRTPFNIGHAIELTGFTLEEAMRALIQGLVDKVDDPETVLKEVLDWTEGQPFLTQKLCKLVVDKAESKQPNIDYLVQKFSIENWQAQDEPEHLRTIRDRILSSERRASRLLGLYQQILLRGAVTADDTPEQNELRLSGLVVKHQGNLRVYNRIYASVFNRNWVEKELANLRPYDEALKGWIANHKDPSWLLRGQALNEALIWTEDKSLSDLCYQFLAASQELDKKEVQSKLEAERNRLNEELVKWLAIGVLVAITLAVLIGMQWQRTQEANYDIFARSLLERAESIAQPDLSRIKVALSIEAIKSSNSVQLKPFLYDDLSLLRRFKPLSENMGSVNAIAFSKRGKYLATAGLANQTGLNGYICLFKKRSDRPWRKLYPAYRMAALLYPAYHEFNSPICISNENTLSNVNAIAFSPDEKYLATASVDGKTCVWETTSGRKITCKNHNVSAGASVVSFSPDGQYLATAGTDGKILVLETKSYKLINSMHHKAGVIAMTFSQDGQYLATTSLDRTARVWNDWNKQNRSNELINLTHENPVIDVSFSPDGQYLATASSDNNAYLWNVTHGNRVQSMKHNGGVLAIAFSQDGQYLATASADTTARIWNTTTGQELVKLEHKGLVTNVAFSPDGQYLATASGDNTARVWEVQSGYEFARLIHKDEVNAIAFSPDNKPLLATASLDGTARVWDLDSDRAVTRIKHKEKVNAIALSQNGESLATATTDKTVRVWRTLSGYEEIELPQHENYVTNIALSPDGKYLATVSRNQIVKVWSLVSNQPNKLTNNLKPESDTNIIAFSSDSKYLVTASLDGSAQLWQMPKVKKVGQPIGHERYLIDVAFSSNGQYLATASRDSSACVWKITKSDNEKVGCVQHQAFVEAIAFSPDNNFFVTGSRDGLVKVSDISDNNVSFNFEIPHDEPVTSVLFSPKDGKYLVTISGNTATIWEIRKTSDRRKIALVQHNGMVTDASFSPDGQYFATASKDKTVRVWKTINGISLETILQEKPVTDVAFTSDGEHLVMTSGETSSNQTTRMLIWRRQKLIEYACLCLKDNLTPKEWKQYVGDNQRYRRTCQ